MPQGRFLRGRYKTLMTPYRIEFLHANGDVFAMHEIGYADDQAAIMGAHEINGSPTIGACFKVWREDHLICHHHNEPGLKLSA